MTLVPDHPIVVRFCPKREAAKPAVVPAKPAQSVPPKSTTQTDLKLCKTYSPDPKPRIAACTRIIESSNPGIADLVAAYHNRCGTRFLANEKVDDALADCTRAVTLDPKSFDAFHVRGVMNSLAGRLDAAIADLTQAIALNPKYIIPYGNRAEAYLRKKDLQKAIADYTTERTLISDPKGAEADFRVHLCWARVALNIELETALSDCDSAVRLEPSAYVYEMRSLARLRMGNLKDARADADKALALDSKNSYALYTRAIVNAREGKTLASNDDRTFALSINGRVAKRYDDIGLKLMVQAENAPFCPALTALIKAAAERAASKAKADVAMPGATGCTAIERGYWCTWETGVAQALAKQKVMATAAATCLPGYARTDTGAAVHPAAVFNQAKTKVVVGTMYGGEDPANHAVGVAVTIAK